MPRKSSKEPVSVQVRMPDGTVREVKATQQRQGLNEGRYDARAFKPNEEWFRKVIAAGWHVAFWNPLVLLASIADGEETVTTGTNRCWSRTTEVASEAACAAAWVAGRRARERKTKQPTFMILERTRPLEEAAIETVWEDTNKCSKTCGKSIFRRVAEQETAGQTPGATSPLGRPRVRVAPAPSGNPSDPRPALPKLVQKIDSPVRKMLEEGLGLKSLDRALHGSPLMGPHAIVGYDSEWVDDSHGRHLLSWQLSELVDDGACVRDTVVFSLTGERMTQSELLALAVRDRGVKLDYRDYQGMWVHLPAEDGKVELRWVAFPGVRRAEDGKRRVRLFYELVSRIPYAEERDALLELVPVPADAPKWVREASCEAGTIIGPSAGSEGPQTGSERIALIPRGLLRADSVYDDDAILDESNEVKLSRTRYRDVFEGTRCEGASIGYTSNYEGTMLGEDGKRDPSRMFDLTVVSHYGIADVSALDSGAFEKDVLVRSSDINGGLVTMMDVYLKQKPMLGMTEFEQVRMRLRDSMCYAPDGCKSLATLGALIGVPKIELDQDECEWKWKEHMDELLETSPETYLDYSANDAVICTMYSQVVHGKDCKLPVTTLSKGVHYVQECIARELGCLAYDQDGVPRIDRQNFDMKYRGLVRVANGCKVASEDSFVPFSRLTPCSTDAEHVLQMCSNAYHGGLNACTYPGLIKGRLTYDLDVRNAYPTMMCVVPDIDWSNPIDTEIRDRDLTFSDFDRALGPTTPLVCEVEFEFGKGVYFPCLPIDVDNSLVFPRSNKGMLKTVMAGPELYLALRLIKKHGGRLHVKRGYRLRVLTDDENRVSYSLRGAVSTLVALRDQCKAEFGKGSLPDLLAKLLSNGCIYGKGAQCVAVKKSYNAFSEGMDDVEGSIITSPYHAMMTTSGVRALLAAMINEAHERGLQVYSVTTDGGITNFYAEELETWELYDLARYFKMSRMFLDASEPRVWEPKHVQDLLMNATTRGNVGFHGGLDETNEPVEGLLAISGMPQGALAKYAGLPSVNAHNSFVTGEVKDSYEDRRALFCSIVTRTGRVSTHKGQPTRFKDLARRNNRLDFLFDERYRKLSMDFDCKRKPVESSMHAVNIEIDGEVYEVATFDTEPWDTVDEYLRAREIKKRLTRVDKKTGESMCLRTIADWKRFFVRWNLPRNSKTQVKDLPWAMVKAVVTLYRQDGLVIPPLQALDPGLNKESSVGSVCAWVNRFIPDSSPHKGKYNRNTWKDARKSNRACQIDETHLDDLIRAMVDDDPESWLQLWD